MEAATETAGVGGATPPAMVETSNCWENPVIGNSNRSARQNML